MEFRIADTFSDSLARLTGDEQKAVKTTAFDLQLNPASPGMSFHKLDRVRDKNFWSVRVNADIRLIVHRSSDSLMLCYVDHHDKAYSWAERRKLETHPKTGAAQLVEIRETVREIVVPTFVEGKPHKPSSKATAKTLFDRVSDDDLLSYGVPAEWLSDVRAATEETLFLVAEHLPGEAAEALLELATGGKPRVAKLTDGDVDPFRHPDAQRRFRVMADVEELARALEFPWEKWTVYLHPEQRQWVERDYAGPARVSGSAGTGKTIVALHRAVHLARSNPDARVLLTTFSDHLASALETRLHRLVSNQPKLAERIDVHSMPAIALRLGRMHLGPVALATPEVVNALLIEAAQSVKDLRLTHHFLRSEWEQVVDAWQLTSWAAYRDVARLGRKTRLPEAKRQLLWSIFEKVQAGLQARQLMTEAALFTRLADCFREGKASPFDFAVVDESQDLGVAQMRLLAALGQGRGDALFFAGDLGQRIFQQPFSWKSLGVDLRGRSRTLRVNYRTSHQIRSQADRLLGAAVTDIDGNSEQRGDTVSVFNGPPPVIRLFERATDESSGVAEWLSVQIKAGILPHEIALFIRSTNELDRTREAASKAAMSYVVLDDGPETEVGKLSISTMHLAKGLEFRSVAVMACDDEIIPSQERIETVGDDADLQEIYDTERQLLYVACTRARDNLLVTSVRPASEFLDDLKADRPR
jgi:superfamily I DNA/RNA helicase/mRNA-degrading endonuclease RelE of RelBE toxin-antitoxin system